MTNSFILWLIVGAFILELGIARIIVKEDHLVHGLFRLCAFIYIVWTIIKEGK